MKNNKGFATRAAQAGIGRDLSTGSISMPIYQTATFSHPGFGQSTGYDYSRSANPTRTAVEDAVADLENGHRAFAFSTGLSATTAIAMLFAQGDHIVASMDLYGGTFRLFDAIFGKYGLQTSYVDTRQSGLVEAAIQAGKTKAIFIETPSNPMMQITDIAAISQIAKKHNLLLIVDNTFMSPWFQRPLELGADLVLHSGTKFLGGHNDTLAGFVVTGSESLSERIYFVQNAVGAVLSPFDSWLIIRGIKTLPIRMNYQQDSARKIVEFLSSHSRVRAVYYPGQRGSPGADVHMKQSSGQGSMVSFRAESGDLAKAMLGAIKIVSFAESLGGVETLMTHPLSQTHRDIPAETREILGIKDDLLRLSVGLEDTSDVIADLKQALELRV